MGFNVKIVDFLVEHKRLTKIGVKRVIRALHLTFELIRVSKRYNIGVRELAKM